MTIKTLSETTVPGPTFTVGLPALFDALAAFAPVSLNRPAVPVLGGVRIASGPDGVGLAAFDYETSVRVQLTTEPGVEQAVVVPFVELSRILKAAIKGEPKKTWQHMSATFTAQIATGTEEHTEKRWGHETATTVREFRRDQAILAVAGFELPLETLPVEDYPELPAVPGAWFVADTAELRDLSARVAESAGDDPTLPMLAGQRWEVRGDTLAMACTDRHKLLVGNTKMRGVRDAEVLIDAAVLGKALKVLDGPLAAGLDPAGKLASLSAGNVTVTMRLPDAEFPRFRNLFPAPDSTSTVVTVDRTQLLKQVLKAQAMLDTRIGQVLLEVADTLTVAPMLSERQDRVKGVKLAAQVDGQPLRTAFNPVHLAGMLAAFGGERVALRITTPTRPVVLAETPSDLGDEAAVLRGLVMPVRLPE